MKNLFFLAILFIETFNSTCYSQADTVYRPKKFIREKGGKTQYSENFILNNVLSDKYKLIILNGEENGDNRISSAVVKLNGDVIAKQSDFNQHVYRIEYEVNLQPKNTLEISLTSKPGSYIMIFIYTDKPVIRDTMPPQLIVGAPVEGLITNQEKIAASGTVSDDSPTELKINNNIIEIIPDGTFTSEVILDYGWNVITITAIDSSGNTTTVTRNVRKDTAPPILTIITPVEGLITKESTVTITGNIIDSTEFTVTIDRDTITIGSDGSINITISLVEGNNTLTLKAEDKAGNITIVERHIIKDSFPPKLTVLEPEEGFLTNQQSITISGIVADSNRVTLRINDSVVLLNPDGSFSTQVTLVEGSNTIAIVAQDTAGNSTTVLRHVTLDTTPPIITITSPTNSLITSQTEIVLLGNVSDINAIVTVNSDTISVDSIGNFAKQITLNEGENKIIVKAIDKTGNDSNQEIVVTLIIKPPLLIVLEPSDGIITNSLSQIVKGNVKDTLNFSLYINSQNIIPDSLGDFEFTINLNEGTNRIEIYADNFLGLRSTEYRTVITDTTRPQVEYNFTMFDSILQVSGTITDSNKVFLIINGEEVQVNKDGTYTYIDSVSDGEVTYLFKAEDIAGNKNIIDAKYYVDTKAPVISVITPIPGKITTLDKVYISGRVMDSSNVTLTVNSITIITDSRGFFKDSVGIEAGTNTLTFNAVDESGNSSEVLRTVIKQTVTIPPDPAAIAPSLGNSISTSIYDVNSFLFQGANPVQFGVNLGVIAPNRISLIRGTVVNKNNIPLSGVRINIFNHPEFGFTMTRGNGNFDLCFNGGGIIEVSISKEGYLPAIRHTETSWNDYAILDTVVLIEPDSKVTKVDFTSGTQIISGSKVVDQDGERTALILFADSTSAVMVLEDSTEISLESMNVRITEYSVGNNGINTMPVVLPPTSAYTYCFSVTADEEIASNAQKIRLSKPAIFYMDNFLWFPVGTRIPVGQIDREKRIWIPKPDGIVLSVVDTVNNKAVISAYQDGLPADSTVLDSLGINDTELIKIAGLYSPGESFWRTEVYYFGIVDCNFATSIIENSEPPVLPIEKKYIKELINEPLTKNVDITGSKFGLTFQSDRQIGNIPEISIQLSNNSLPAGLNYVSLKIEIEGRKFYYEFQPLPDMNKSFVWDGKDAFGRVFPGKHKANIEVGYWYQGKYQWPADMAASFAASSGTEIPTVYSRERIVSKQEYTVEIPLMDNRLMGLGGWNLSPFHSFDLNENVLYYGDGRKRESVRMGKDVIIAAGNVHGISFTDGMIATKPNLGSLSCPEVAEEGTVYFFGSPYSIYKVTPDGRLHKMAGGVQRRASERNDGYPANGTRIGAVNGIALDKEGNIYFTEGDYHLIRKIDTNGILSTIAGTQVSSYSGDGGLAINAGLANPGRIEVMDDGTIYFSDQTYVYNGNNCIRKIGTDGIITTVAGGGSETDYTKFPATKLKLYPTFGLIKDKNGNIYFTTQQNFYGNLKTSHKLFKLSPDGWLTSIGGNGGYYSDFNDEGKNANNVEIGNPSEITFDHNENLLLITSHSNPPRGSNGYKVWSISPEGKINSYFGSGKTEGNAYLADSLPKLPLDLNCIPNGLATGPDGSIYITSEYNLIRLAKAAPGFSGEEFSIPNNNGSQLFYFDSKGHHIRTENTYTGKVLYTFLYDNHDLIVSIIDKDSLVTTIERDSLGNMKSIITPYGDKTDFTLNTDGYISSITNPNGETINIQYTDDGLLTAFSDAKNNQSNYEYDESGNLVSWRESENGDAVIDHSGETKNFASGTSLPLGAEYMQNATEKDNLTTEVVTLINNREQTTIKITPAQTDTIITPDGMRTIIEKGYDQRFGAQVPVLDNACIITPSGIKNSTAKKNIITIIEGPVIKGFEDRITQNGKLTLCGWNGNDRMTYNISPEGRQQVTYLNEKDQVIQEAVQGIYPSNYSYDSYGRMKTQSKGTRTSSYSYDSKGRLFSVTDPVDRTTRMYYDNAGRVTKNILADGREVNYTYDVNGNLTSIIPPGRDAHIFEYNRNNVNSSYTPPIVAEDSLNATRYLFNEDGSLTATILPDGSVINTIYDTTGGVQSNGKVKAVTFDRGLISYDYNYNTGQVVSVTAPGGNSISYEYDGSLTSAEIITGEVNGKVSTTYNNDFMPANQSVNDSLTLTFAYDKDGLLTRAGDLHIIYNPQNGLPVSDSLMNIKTVYSYNNYGEITGYNASYLNSSLYSYNFVRDDLGRITGKTETVDGSTENTEYIYNTSGQLAEVKKNGVIVSEYEYDSNGNRIKQFTMNDHLMTMDTVYATYDAQDRLIEYGDEKYIHNKNGYLIAKIYGTDTTKYTYDNFGNLITVLLPDGKLIEYLIDANNRRIGKKVDGVVIKKWLYSDGLLPVAELDSADNIKVLYGSGYIVKNDTTYRVITDQLGSVKLVVNAATGEIVQNIQYDEFGNITNVLTQNEFTDFTFAGGFYDTDTKLTRFGARDYNASIGRWTARDPILFEAGDANLYGYVINDPVNAVDPLGTYTGVSDFQAYQTAVNISDSYVSAAGELVLQSTLNVTQELLLAGATTTALGILTLEEIKENNLKLRVYRVYGGTSKINGPSWTINNPFESLWYRSEAGLPNSNTGEYFVTGILNDYTGVIFKTADKMYGWQKGGWQETVIPNAANQVINKINVPVNPVRWGPIGYQLNP